jgi:hypothetical protein
VSRKTDALAREVYDNGFAQAGHVVGQRSAQGGRKDIHLAFRKASAQKLHDRMAAHKIANPHVGND